MELRNYVCPCWTSFALTWDRVKSTINSTDPTALMVAPVQQQCSGWVASATGSGAVDNLKQKANEILQKLSSARSRLGHNPIPAAFFLVVWTLWGRSPLKS
jgi:hypothetical protein